MRFNYLFYQHSMEALAQEIQNNNIKLVALIDTSQPDDDFGKKMSQLCREANEAKLKEQK